MKDEVVVVALAVVLCALVLLGLALLPSGPTDTEIAQAAYDQAIAEGGSTAQAIEEAAAAIRGRTAEIRGPGKVIVVLKKDWED